MGSGEQRMPSGWVWDAGRVFGHRCFCCNVVLSLALVPLFLLLLLRCYRYCTVSTYFHLSHAVIASTITHGNATAFLSEFSSFRSCFWCGRGVLALAHVPRSPFVLLGFTSS